MASGPDVTMASKTTGNYASQKEWVGTVATWGTPLSYITKNGGAPSQVVRRNL